jgi:hypothetical protein
MINVDLKFKEISNIFARVYVPSHCSFKMSPAFFSLLSFFLNLSWWQIKFAIE